MPFWNFQKYFETLKCKSRVVFTKINVRLRTYFFYLIIIFTQKDCTTTRPQRPDNNDTLQRIFKIDLVWYTKRDRTLAQVIFLLEGNLGIFIANLIGYTTSHSQKQYSIIIRREDNAKIVWILNLNTYLEIPVPRYVYLFIYSNYSTTFGGELKYDLDSLIIPVWMVSAE